MWLKFNDNTVTEASWEELLKESVGGHSNTSAYSLVYVQASKTELFETDNKMEEELLGEEALLSCLPNDLSEFVSGDNSNFQKEITVWDEEQKSGKSKSTAMEPDTSVTSSNEVVVVQEKLTYVHTHASLVIKTSSKCISSVSPDNMASPQLALQVCNTVKPR